MFRKYGWKFDVNFSNPAAALPVSRRYYDFMNVFGEIVRGIEVDAQTRCAHYHRDIDIIAIKFKCCGAWYPCFECHKACCATDHQPQVWSKDELAEKAILCGNCGHKLTIGEYFDCGSICPACRADFNPRCALHYDLYFEV